MIKTYKKTDEYILKLIFMLTLSIVLTSLLQTMTYLVLTEGTVCQEIHTSECLVVVCCTFPTLKVSTSLPSEKSTGIIQFTTFVLLC